MSYQRPHGTYNLTTGQDARIAVGLVGDAVQVYQGENFAVDAGIETLEAMGTGFSLVETSEAVITGMTPADLQSASIRRSHFSELGLPPSFVGRMVGDVVSAGVSTYADILALGSDKLRELSKHVYRGMTIGKGALAHISAATFRQTGMRIPIHQATPQEQLRYYEDIETATLALGLPFGGIQCHERLPRVVGRTIGDVLRVDARTGVLADFAGALTTNIILPFNQAKMQQEQ